MKFPYFRYFALAGGTKKTSAKRSSRFQARFWVRSALDNSSFHFASKSVKRHHLIYLCLTLFYLGGGHYGPPYHISIGCYRAVRGRFTKFHDFVPFGICQDPVKLLLTFFTKKFEKLDVENFWGSSSIRWKWEKIKKNFFFPFSPNARGPPKISEVWFFKLFGKKCQK